MQTLFLGNNALMGSLPLQFSTLAKLRDLDVGSNAMEGPVFSILRYIVGLRRLDISFNNFSGSLDGIGSWLELMDLNLEGNAIGGTITGEIGGLISLQTLNLNGMSSYPKAAFRVSKLTYPTFMLRE